MFHNMYRMHTFLQVQTNLWHIFTSIAPRIVRKETDIKLEFFSLKKVFHKTDKTFFSKVWHMFLKNKTNLCGLF